MNALITFIAAVVVHEIAHYVAWKSMNVEPKISVTWFGFEVGSVQQIMKSRIIDNMFVLLAGPAIGAIVLMNASIIIDLAYVITCSGDLMQIVSHIELARKYGFKTRLIDAEKKYLEEVEKEK